MTAAEYKAERERRGTQQGVAARLCVDYRTVQRREAGTIAITHEAELAIRALSVAGRGGAGGRRRVATNDELSDGPSKTK